MRPLKLTISAFGPYAGEVKLDLNSLGNNGIYLITGETGAGKTTIFDGIAFALFGEPSGDNREPTMLRSKYAAAETPTFVELVFEYGGKEYTIRRNPDYERPKNRGEGMTREKADAILIYPTGKIVTKVTDVNSAVRDVLGVDRNQFAQISMIAQGDFLKLLLADTRERQGIFRDIFKTEYYNTFQNKLKEESKVLEDKCDSGMQSVSQYIGGLLCDEDNVLAIEFDKAKAGEMSTSAVLDLINKILEEDNAEYSKHEKNLATLEKTLESLTEKITKAEATVKNQGLLVEAQDRAELSKKNLSHLERVFQEEKAKTPEREKLLKDISKIETKLPSYDELEECNNKAKENIKQLNEVSENLRKSTNETEKLGKEIKEYKEQLKTLENAGANKEKLTAKRAEYVSEKTQLEELNIAILELDSLEQNYKSMQQVYLEYSQSAKEANDKHSKKNRAFLDEQAGVLADSLEEGMPCPVCGSKEHPVLAAKGENAPTEAELEELKKAADISGEKANHASQRAAGAKGTYDEKAKVVKALIEKLLGKTDADAIPKLIEERIEEASNCIINYTEKIAKEEDAIKRKKIIDEKLPSMEKAFDEAGRLMEDLKLAISSAKAKGEEIASQCKLIKEKLEFESKAIAEEMKKNMESELAALERKLKEAEEAYLNCSKEIQTIDGQIVQLKTFVENAEELNLEELNREKITVTTEKNGILEKQKDLASRIDTNSRGKTGIENKMADLEELEEKLTWVRAISNTANGNLSGKEKIMLETYIQMTYFDRILHRANLRLAIMSGNQYTLKRRDEASNNKSQSGLELDVIDHYNGTERSVKSLSGGESFKASLSLALGLSDEVQSSAGGIKLDTMFVDEGFGSLDEESLQQAMNALTSLSDGNRLVGIISHVPELKNRIDRQIVVNKEKTGGSKAVII